MQALRWFHARPRVNNSNIPTGLQRRLPETPPPFIYTFASAALAPRQAKSLYLKTSLGTVECSLTAARYCPETEASCVST